METKEFLLRNNNNENENRKGENNKNKKKKVLYGANLLKVYNNSNFSNLSNNYEKINGRNLLKVCNSTCFSTSLLSSSLSSSVSSLSSPFFSCFSSSPLCKQKSNLFLKINGKGEEIWKQETEKNMYFFNEKKRKINETTKPVEKTIKKTEEHEIKQRRTSTKKRAKKEEKASQFLSICSNGKVRGKSTYKIINQNNKEIKNAKNRKRKKNSKCSINNTSNLNENKKTLINKDDNTSKENSFDERKLLILDQEDFSQIGRINTEKKQNECFKKFESLYTTFNIHSDANQNEIRHKYKYLVSLHHPDKGGNKEDFQKIQFAYEILSCPYRRSMYDKFGASMFRFFSEKEKIYFNKKRSYSDILQSKKEKFLNKFYKFFEINNECLPFNNSANVDYNNKIHDFMNDIRNHNKDMYDNIDLNYSSINNELFFDEKNIRIDEEEKNKINFFLRFLKQIFVFRFLSESSSLASLPKLVFDAKSYSEFQRFVDLFVDFENLFFLSFSSFFFLCAYFFIKRKQNVLDFTHESKRKIHHSFGIHMSKPYTCINNYYTRRNNINNGIGLFNNNNHRNTEEKSNVDFFYVLDEEDLEKQIYFEFLMKKKESSKTQETRQEEMKRNFVSLSSRFFKKDVNQKQEEEEDYKGKVLKKSEEGENDFLDFTYMFFIPLNSYPKDNYSNLDEKEENLGKESKAKCGAIVFFKNPDFFVYLKKMIYTLYTYKENFENPRRIFDQKTRIMNFIKASEFLVILLAGSHFLPFNDIELCEQVSYQHKSQIFGVPIVLGKNFEFQSNRPNKTFLFFFCKLLFCFIFLFVKNLQT